MAEKRQHSLEQVSWALDSAGLMGAIKDKLEHSFMIVQRQAGRDVETYQFTLTQLEIQAVYALVRQYEIGLYVEYVDDIGKVSGGRA